MSERKKTGKEKKSEKKIVRERQMVPASQMVGIFVFFLSLFLSPRENYVDV